MKKRIFTAMAAVMLFFGMTILAGAQETPHKEENILKGLGIHLPEQEETVKRSDLAEIAADFFPKYNEIGECDFRDVSQNDSYYRAVCVGVGMGIIQGNGGYFEPQREVKYEEAVKVAVSIAGYADIADLDGYPQGYLRQAASMRILDGLTSKTGEAISREDVIRLFYNLLSAKIVEYDSQEKKYTVSATETVLSSCLDAVKIKGRVIATELTALGDQAATSEGKCAIENTVYYNGEINAKQLIGFNVLAYAQRRDAEDDMYTLVYAEEEQEKLVIRTEDVDKVQGYNAEDPAEYRSNPRITYYDKNAKRSATLTADCAFIFNLTVSLGISDEDFKKEPGEIELYDCDQDGRYDTVRLNTYQVYIVDNVDGKNGRVTFYNSREVLDVSRLKNSTPKIEKFGKSVDVQNLAKYDVLCIKTERNKSFEQSEILEIAVSNTILRTTVQSINKGDNKITTPEGEYRCDASAIDDLSVGHENVLYLDISSRVVYVRGVQESGMQYAYLIRAEAYDEGGDIHVVMRCIDFDGNSKKFELAEKVSYTGNNADDLQVTARSVKREDLVQYPQVKNAREIIQYALDGDNKISKLIMPQLMSDADYDGFNEEKFTIDAVIAGDDCKIHTNIISKSYNVTDDVVVVVDPGTGVFDDISIGGKATLSGLQGKLEKIEVYNADNRLKTAMIVAKTNAITGKGALPETTAESNLLLVKNVATAVNDKNDIVYEVRGMREGKEVAYKTKKESLQSRYSGEWDGYKTDIADLTFGDIILVELNLYNEITDFYTIFSMENKTLPQTPKYVEYRPADGYLTISNTSYGQVDKNINGTILKLNTDSDRHFSVSGNVYICNMESGILETGSAAEAQPGEMAFIKCRRTEVKDIVIYK